MASAVSTNTQSASAVNPTQESSPSALPSTSALGGTDKGAAVLTETQLEALYKKADAEALRILTAHAEAGEPGALFSIGLMFANGHGARRDEGEASRLYKLAGDYAAAQFQLGLMYAKRPGDLKDASQAIRYFNKAAAQGYAPAQIELKKMADKPLVQPVPLKVLTQEEIEALYTKGDAEAFNIVKVHAEAGEPNAQNCLGMMYDHGLGVGKDEFEAFLWYHKAAEKGFAKAQYNLAIVYTTTQGVIARDEKEAERLFKEAAAQGFEKAQIELKRLTDKALIEAARGAKGPLTDEQIDALYAKGDAEAFGIVEAHAQAREANAQNCLGKMYQNGRGVGEYDLKAVEWFEFAAKQQFPDAEYNLALMHETGRGVRGGELFKSYNRNTALLNYIFATKHGHQVAPFNLAKLYDSGLIGGTRKDTHPAKAVENLKLAAARGYEPAKAELARRGISFTPSDEKKEEKKQPHCLLTKKLVF